MYKHSTEEFTERKLNIKNKIKKGAEEVKKKMKRESG